MTTKEKLALLDSFYAEAIAAGMGAKFHCDGILLISCYADLDGKEDEQRDLEIPLTDREAGRAIGDGGSKGAEQ